VQKELDRALAAREAERNIAAVQLDRVRMQMAECTRPLQYTAVSVSFSLDALGEKLESAWGREQQIGGSGGSLEPPGPLLEPPMGLFLRTSIPFSWYILSAFLPA
jgi:hypothetical protein